MKTYLLPEDVRTAILNYLNGRPYADVVKGVDALKALQEAQGPDLYEVKPGPELVAVQEGKE